MAISTNCSTVNGCSAAAHGVSFGLSQTIRNANVRTRHKSTFPSYICSRRQEHTITVCPTPEAQTRDAAAVDGRVEVPRYFLLIELVRRRRTTVRKVYRA